MNGHSMGFDYLMAKHGFEVYVPDTFIMVDTSCLDGKTTTPQMIKNRNAVSRMKRVAQKQYNSVCRCEKYHYVNATEEPGNLYCLHCLKKPR